MTVKRTIRARLSMVILLIVLLTVSIISLLSNYFINRQFAAYITKQQALKTQIIQSSLGQQYDPSAGRWNLDYIHSVGMSYLYEGYIIKVADVNGRILWDAQAHDMNLCNRIMEDVSERMAVKYPNLQGEFVSDSYPLLLGIEKIGTVSISYFGPFFLNDNDFMFLNSLNRILITVGIIAFAVSLAVSGIMAKRLSRPILRTVEATKQIADGNYAIRLEEKTGTIELELLVRSINHLAKSLETLEKLRKQLTEDVAHELRTPITILQSHIEAMLEGIWEPTEDKLQSCYEESQRIGTLVSDLENLTKIESSSLELTITRFSLKELIEKTMKEFEVELHGKGLRAEITGEDLFLSADRDRISQVVSNLLSNAVKYTGEGGSILFELFRLKEGSGFHIRDTGIGIPENELPFIFERFYRADKSRNRMTGGTGIGLAIVKSIVEAHGGSVTVTSRIQEGTTFTVIFPGNPISFVNY